MNRDKEYLLSGIVIGIICTCILFLWSNDINYNERNLDVKITETNGVVHNLTLKENTIHTSAQTDFYGLSFNGKYFGFRDLSEINIKVLPPDEK